LTMPPFSVKENCLPSALPRRACSIVSPWSSATFCAMRWPRELNHGPFPIVVEALDEPHYLAWTWGHESDDHPVTLVEWRLSEVESCTQLTLTESGIRTPDHFAGNSEGWDEELAELTALLEATVTT